MEASDALSVVFARNAFYRRLHFLVLGTLALCIFVIVFLTITLVYLIKHPPYPIYFATDKVGRLINVIPVTMPNMTTDDVLKWAIDAVQKAYSLDYINYRNQLQSSQKYFTPYGWRNYMQALTLSNNLRAIIERKYVAVAQVVGPPKILAEGILGGSYAWRFQMPMLITYMYPPFDSNSKYSNPLNVNVIVQRQPILQSADGLGIVQIISELTTAPSNQPTEMSTGQ